MSNDSNKLDTEFRYYGILVPIINIGGDLHLLFEVRSHRLRRQPGEICFPGGKKESNETFKEAAIREAVEELNILKSSIEILGKLPSVGTHYNNIIYPFVGILHDVNFKEIDFNRAEVDHIFSVPIDFFRESAIRTFHRNTAESPRDFPIHLTKWEDYPWFKGKYQVYFYQYGSCYLGLTAKTIKILWTHKYLTQLIF